MGAGAEAEFAWAIDPIDGTRAFASGLPVWGISAGVLRHGQPWAGGFYLPVTGEMYWGSVAEPGQAWYNQRRIPRLAPPDPDSMLTFLAVPSDFHHHFEVGTPRIRSMGSTAAHLAYVATGAALGMLTSKTNLWDIAGVLPLALAVGVELATCRGVHFRPAICWTACRSARRWWLPTRLPSPGCGRPCARSNQEYPKDTYAHYCPGPRIAR